MYHFTYENQGTNTYLVYQVDQNDEIDSLSLGMVTNNQIPGLAPTVFMQMDALKYIKFNVSAKISVKQFFSGPVNRHRLLGVFNGIVAAMLSAEDYMIDDRMILLDTDYIFADVSTCETVLICLPIQNSIKPMDLGTFFKDIMFNTQFDQTENCDYVARIINYLNSAPVFSLPQFKSVLDELNGNNTAKANIAKENTPVSAYVPQKEKKPVNNQPPIVNKPQPSVPPQAVQTQVQNAVPIAPPQNNQPLTGFQVPPNSAPVNNAGSKMPPVVPNKEQQPATDEKGISLLYLLGHYNSENAAAYKAQKAAKKDGVTVQTAAPSPKKEKGSGKKKNNNEAGGPSFAIPGQNATIGGVAVPPAQNQQPQPARQVPQAVQPQVQPNRPMQPQPPMQPIPTPAQPTQPPIQQARPAYVPIPQTPQTAPVQSQMRTSSPANFGGVTVLGGNAGETTVLNAGAAAVKQINPHMVRVKTKEQIPVDKPVYRIGKEKSYVDYFIADNTAISRSHANIITKGEKYFVIDTNSTNHTFVNGKMIPSSTEVEISHGTKLRFANEDFEFLLY